MGGCRERGPEGKKGRRGEESGWDGKEGEGRKEGKKGRREEGEEGEERGKKRRDGQFLDLLAEMSDLCCGGGRFLEEDVADMLLDAVYSLA